MRIAIATVATPDIQDYARYSLALNSEYAVRHRYDFHVLTTPSPDRHPSWGKIEFARRLLPMYDWLFIIDADAVFLQLERSLEPFTELGGDFLICENGPNGGRPLNSGAMLLRNTAPMHHLLRRLYTGGAQYATRAFWEQEAVNDLFEEEAAHQNGVSIQPLPFDTFNSHFMDHLKPDFDNRFVLHVMANALSVKVQVFRQILADRLASS